MASGTIKKPIKEFDIIRRAATNNSFSVVSNNVNTIVIACGSTDIVLAAGVEVFPLTSWPLVTSIVTWGRPNATQISINFSSSSAQNAKVTGWALVKVEK